MPAKDRRATEILRLLQSCARITGMRICYHDYLLRLGLPYEYTVHESEFCLHVKEQHRTVCGGFCGADGEVDRCIAEYPGGWLHRCPFGCLKIAAGVFHDEILAGVLFAQAPRASRASQASQTIPAPPLPRRQSSLARKGDPATILEDADEWSLDRLRIIHAVAEEIGSLLRPEPVRPGKTRRGQIMRYIEQNLADSPRLEGLGRELNLSASRAGHLVEEIFGENFTALVRQVRCNRAALLLAATAHPVSEIALRLGFSDQSHLIRTFKIQTGLTPLAYRKKSGSRDLE